MAFIGERSHTKITSSFTYLLFRIDSPLSNVSLSYWAVVTIPSGKTLGFPLGKVLPSYWERCWIPSGKGIAFLLGKVLPSY